MKVLILSPYPQEIIKILEKNEDNYLKLIKNNCMITMPNMILNCNIDGYFASYLKKIK